MDGPSEVRVGVCHQLLRPYDRLESYFSDHRCCPPKLLPAFLFPISPSVCVCTGGVSCVRVDENTRCAMLIKTVLLNIVNIGQFTFSPANGIRM